MAESATVSDVEQLIVRKFQQKFRSLREAFQSLDVRGDSVITAVELQNGLAVKFDLSITDELAQGLVAKYNRTAPGGEPAFNFDSFAEMYEGTFSQYVPSSIGSAAPAGVGGISRAFIDGELKSVAVSETQEQRALSIVRRIGRKLRQHASSSERSRHFTKLFVKMDVDRTGYLSADEIGLGMWQLGLELSAADLTCLFDTVDTQYVGRISIAKFMLLVQRGAGVDAAEPQAGVGVAGATSPAEGEGDDEAIPEHHFAVEPAAVPADFKRAIAEGSPAHAAVAKIVSALDERKIQLKAAFQKLDRDGDGSISAQDLPEGLAKIGVYVSPTRAAKLVRTFDRTGDGRLHYHEFIRLLSHTRAEEHEAKSAQTRRQSQPLSPSPPKQGDAKEAPAAAPAAAAPEPESAEGGEGEGELVAAGTTDDGIGEEEAADEESVSDVLAAISFSVYSRFRGARKAFEHLDRAGNKVVSKAEMEAALRKAGVECSAAELDAIYERFDVDGTGALSFSQFVKLLAAAAAADHA